MFNLQKEISTNLRKRLPGCRIIVSVPPASREIFGFLVDRVFDSFEDGAEGKAIQELAGKPLPERIDRLKQYRSFLSRFSTYFGDTYYRKIIPIAEVDPNGFVVLGPELYQVDLVNQGINYAWAQFEGAQAFRPRAAGGLRRRRWVPWPFARVQN